MIEFFIVTSDPRDTGLLTPGIRRAGPGDLPSPPRYLSGQVNGGMGEELVDNRRVVQQAAQPHQHRLLCNMQDWLARFFIHN